jgi:sarcosine oxidase, subunit alpha
VGMQPRHEGRGRATRSPTDGQAGDGGAVDTLAAALLVRGERAISRSFRFHRPRGAMCARGYCHQCKVTTVDGQIGLACQLPATVERKRPGSWGLAQLSIDPLRLPGKLAERLPPWFYERRMRRPAALRQLYLRLVRRLPSAPPLPAHAPKIGGAWQERETEVLVVGGGPAGLAVAAEFASAGREVLLVEHEQLGGSARWLPNESPPVAERVDEAHRAGAALLERALCLGLYGEEQIAACVGPDEVTRLSFRELVVATGAYDRPLIFAGNDLPGIMGGRAFERFLAVRAVPSSARIGVFGAPEEIERALSAAAAAGVRVEWVASPATLPESGVPSFPGTELVRVRGRRALRAVELAGPGHMPCDVLVLGFTQPTYELQVQAGLLPELEGAPPVIVPRGEARYPLLVVGEAAGWRRVEEIEARSRATAKRWLAGGESPPRRPPHLPAAGRAHPDAFLCLCEDVRLRDLDRAVSEGFGEMELFKRRSGAGTGPCQGKMCLCLIAAAARDRGIAPVLPTQRPPTRPVSIAALAGGDHG